MKTDEGNGKSMSPDLWPRPDYAFESEYWGYSPPDDKTIPIWRYMDFTKFVSMLESRSLFFARADLLGDPWEGSLTRADIEEREKFENRLREEGRPLPLYGLLSEKIQSEVTNSIVSCWHMNGVESMAMWRLYLTGINGVAVRSTFDRLTMSLHQFDGQSKGLNEDGTEKEIRIHAGTVHYVDFEGRPPDGVPRILLKRKSFEHEREIRAVAKDTSWGNSPRFGEDGQPMTRFGKGGDYVPVNLDVLVSGIYVSPEAQSWFADLVQRVVTRYGFDFPVHQSDLARDPVF